MKNALLLVVAAVVVFAASCGDEPTDGNDGKLQFSSLYPTTVWHGDTITIAGRNFGANRADITILFDTLASNPLSFISTTPVSVSNYSIRAIIPDALKERIYRVTLRKKAETVAAGPITIAYTMLITSVSPATAWRGDTITINGRKFDSTAADVTVLLDSLTLKPISVRNDNIRFVAPQTVVAKTYAVAVRKKNESVTAAQQIVMRNPKPMFIATVQPLKAWRYDTITIAGSNFGTVKNNIVVLFDSLAATPVSVDNDIVRVLVPKEVIAKPYTITVRKADESVIAAQKVAMEAGKFQFQKAVISVRIDGIQYKYEKSYSESSSTVKSDTIPGSWKYGQTLSQCKQYNTQSCYVNFSPPAISICCRTLMNSGTVYEATSMSVTGVPDTTARIIPALEATYSAGAGNNAGHSDYTKNTTFSISLKNARYQELTEGIEISYSGAALQDIAPVVKYSFSEKSSYFSGTMTGSSKSDNFIPSGVYAPDNYIKITLYR